MNMNRIVWEGWTPAMYIPEVVDHFCKEAKIA